MADHVAQEPTQTADAPPQGSGAAPLDAVPPQGEDGLVYRAIDTLAEYIVQTKPIRPELDIWNEILAISTDLHRGGGDRDDPNTARLIATVATHLPSPDPPRWDLLAQIAEIHRRVWVDMAETLETFVRTHAAPGLDLWTRIVVYAAKREVFRADPLYVALLNAVKPGFVPLYNETDVDQEAQGWVLVRQIAMAKIPRDAFRT